MDINGLPLHPLVVHAAVVLGPVAALAALAYAAVPRWRAWLRWPLLAVALLALVSIWAAYLTGEDFREDPRFAGATGVFAERLERHEELAEGLRIATTVFALLAVAQVWLHGRAERVPAAVRVLVPVLLAVAAVATLVWTVLTGDAGAQAVYGQ